MRTTFSSDNGPPCHVCKGTIYEYICDDTVSLIDTVCISCRACNLISHTPTPTTAQEASAVHRLAIR
jgi:hypothetical protein